MEFQQDKKSVKLLSRYEYLKQLYFGKRGYEYCPETGLRITDYDKAVYDENYACMFLDRNAYNNYISDKRNDGIKKKSFGGSSNRKYNSSDKPILHNNKPTHKVKSL